MVETIRRWHGHEIQMQMLEPLWRDFEVSDGGYNMFENFSLLARDALSGPLTDVLLNVGPDKFVSY